MWIRFEPRLISKTAPTRFFVGTRPQTRESHDELRLSPRGRDSPGGILPPGYDSESRCAPGMYGSRSGRPSIRIVPARSDQRSWGSPITRLMKRPLDPQTYAARRADWDTTMLARASRTGPYGRTA